MLKKKIMIPVILILIMTLGILTGCYERVETEGYEYDGEIVTLYGRGPSEDLFGRILDKSELEFRFYNGRFDNWEDSYRTVKAEYTHTSDERVYFKAEVDDLEKDETYYVRAFGYYRSFIPEDPKEDGWGYSVHTMKVKPGAKSSTTNSIQIQYNDNVKLQMLIELVLKNPRLRELFLENTLGFA